MRRLRSFVRLAPIITLVVALAAALAPAALAHDWNGLVRDRDGDVYSVDAEDGWIWRVAPDGKARGFVTGETAIALNHPHHLALDEEQRLWLGSG